MITIEESNVLAAASVVVASERFVVLVGHWLCRVDPGEVKVHLLHPRQCEVHVHAAPPAPPEVTNDRPRVPLSLCLFSSFFLRVPIEIRYHRHDGKSRKSPAQSIVCKWRFLVDTRIAAG